MGLPSDWDEISSLLISESGLNIEIEAHNLWCDLQNINENDSDYFDTWVAAFTQNLLDTKPGIVVGYSLGGRLLAHLPWHKFDFAKSIVFLSSRLVPLSGIHRSERLANDTAWGQSFLSQPWDKVVDMWNSQEVFKADTSKITRLENDFTRKDLDRALVGWSTAKQRDLFKEIPNWSSKGLWCYGENDRSYVEQARLINSSKIGLKTHLFKGSGHRIPFTKPRDVVNLLLSIQTDI